MVFLSTLPRAIATAWMVIAIWGLSSSAQTTYDIETCEDLEAIPATATVEDVVLELNANAFDCSSVRTCTSRCTDYWVVLVTAENWVVLVTAVPAQ